MAYRHTTITSDHKWLSLDPDILALYNHNDCLATALLARRAPALLREHNNWDFYQQEVAPLVPAAIAMQLRGIPIDTARRQHHRDTLRQIRKECDSIITEFATSVDLPEFNPNSPTQRAQLLYTSLGFKPRYKKGKITTDQDALLATWRNLLKREEHLRPLLEALLHRSRINTILTRYLNFPLDADNHIRPTAKIFGAKTMRYAYDDPPLQQFVKEIRDMVRAPRGYRITSLDYSALEARILAYQFQDTRDIECFENSWDIHLVTANDLFQLQLDAQQPFATWTKQQWNSTKSLHEERRTATKNYRYGKAYGGSAASMKTRTFCPCETWGCAAHLPPTLDRNLMIRAEVAWNDQHRDYENAVLAKIDEVRETRTYVSPFGFTRYFTKPFGAPNSPAEGERELRNFFGQHPAAVIINRAQRRAHAANLPIIFQMHDALTLLSPEPQADEHIAQMVEIMEAPVPEFGGAKFPVDVTTGDVWK